MTDTKQVSVAVASDDAEEEIRCCVGMGAGIAKDVRRRWPLYADDWKQGMSVGLHIFAPATYIFFASVLPALAFGEQFRDETLGLFSIPHILCATAIAACPGPGFTWALPPPPGPRAHLGPGPKSTHLGA